MSKKVLTNLLLAGCLASSAFAATDPHGSTRIDAQQRAGDSDPLDAARELYASARYDEALVMLNNMRPSEAREAIDRRSIAQYRSLCLLALGRGSEAEAAIEAVVNTDPMFQPSEADASPRVRSAFTEVRQRLLPEIAASRYAAAKATYDRKEFALAQYQFDELMKLLDDPAMGRNLGDLKTLASGFRELAAAAAAPPPPPARPEKRDPEPPPPPPAPAPQPAKIYGPDDSGVSVPVSIRQNVPPVPAAIMSQVRDRGRVEVVLDEQGRVVQVTMRQSMHPMYDGLVVAAARDWRYRPAQLNGVPVKYRKTILISVTR
jgi:TonB family protein